MSNALSGSGYVRDDTRAQVLDAAKRLGYRASSVARGLRMQRSWSVGLLLADIANPWFPELVRGVEDVLWSAQINLVLCNTDYQAEKEDAYLRHLLDKRVDGLILASTGAESPAVPRCRRRVFPWLCSIAAMAASRPTMWAWTTRAASPLLSHLAELGHSRIAFIAGGSAPARRARDGKAICSPWPRILAQRRRS